MNGWACSFAQGQMANCSTLPGFVPAQKHWRCTSENGSAFVTNNAVDMQQIVDRFSPAADMFGLTINISKIELLYQPLPMSIELPETITVHDEPLKTTESFTYLGSTVTNTNSADLEVERRIQSAPKAYGALQKRLWSCNDNKQSEGLLSCSHPLPALFHRVHRSLPRAHHGSDKTPASPPTPHPQHQVARPYPRRWGTAPSSHSQCWSPKNCVSFAGQDMYVGWPIAGCQKLCSTRNYAKVKGAMEDKNCVLKMSWSGIWRKQTSRMIPGRRRHSRESNGEECWGRPRQP